MFIEQFDALVSPFYLALGIFSAFGSGMAYNLVRGLKEKAASVAIIIYSGLIYGISIGWIVFGERQTLFSLFGMFLVVLGMVFSVLYSKRRISAETLEVTNG